MGARTNVEDYSYQAIVRSSGRPPGEFLQINRFVAMQRFVHGIHLVLLLALLGHLAACGDVGDAPQAQTSDAVPLAEIDGATLPIDTSRSEVRWRAAKVTRSHDGGFRSFDGTVSVAGNDVTGVRLHIDTRSIWSDSDRLTNHLKSDDFFDVGRYPTATFESAQVVPTDSAEATHLVTGNLSMHGRTNGVTFPAAILVDNGTVKAQADFIIDRTDWDISYTGQADDLIENDVRLIFDIVTARDQPVSNVQAE